MDNALSDQHAAIGAIGAFTAAGNAGLTEAQLRGLVRMLRSEVGPEQGDAALRILEPVLQHR